VAGAGPLSVAEGGKEPGRATPGAAAAIPLGGSSSVAAKAAPAAPACPVRGTKRKGMDVGGADINGSAGSKEDVEVLRSAGGGVQQPSDANPRGMLHKQQQQQQEGGGRGSSGVEVGKSSVEVVDLLDSDGDEGEEEDVERKEGSEEDVEVIETSVRPSSLKAKQAKEPKASSPPPKSRAWGTGFYRAAQEGVGGRIHVMFAVKQEQDGGRPANFILYRPGTWRGKTPMTLLVSGFVLGGRVGGSVSVCGGAGGGVPLRGMSYLRLAAARHERTLKN
jgi:hypothetical protein